MDWGGDLSGADGEKWTKQLDLAKNMLKYTYVVILTPGSVALMMAIRDVVSGFGDGFDVIAAANCFPPTVC